MEMRAIFSVALIILFYTTIEMSHGLSNDFLLPNEAIESRFQKMEDIIHQQTMQIMNQNYRIEGLENVISKQQSEMYESEKRFKEQRKLVYLLEGTINTQLKEINALKEGLSVVVSNQNRITKKLHFILKGNSSLVEKSDSKVRTKNAEITEQVAERDRRLLLGSIQPTTSSTQATAFFAFFSHIEYNLATHHILIFDTIKTNINNAYSEFTGVFTTPASGVYGFLYTLRMACSSSNRNLFAPFEMVRNNVVESVVGIYQHGCGDQATVTGHAIIHANQGDKIYVRTHPTFQIEGSIISDTNGLASFSGWLISADTYN